MTKIFTASTTLVLIFLLSGCLSWVNRSNPNADYQQDKGNCEMLSYRSLPEQVTTGTRNNSTYTTNCNKLINQINCVSVPESGSINQASDQIIGMMRLDNLRQDYVNSCMRSKGWRLESDR